MPAGPDPITAARRPVGAWCSNGSGGSIALVQHRLEDLVAGVPVAVADGDCLVHLVAPAVLLAWRRADAPEDAREGDGPLEDARGLAPVGFGVCLEEARDVDVARALVLARRQAIGVVVREDQLEVRPPETSNSSVWVWTFISGSHVREQEIGGCSSPSTSTTHIRQAPNPGSFGS